MELKEVILGFLEWKQLTGYELKGMFFDLDFLPWSGNNNQIYKALVELEREGLVEKEVVMQENYPPQKRYRATEEGGHRLRKAVLTPAERLTVRNDFLLHLAWAECLCEEELLGLLDAYQRQVESDLAMYREKLRRAEIRADRSSREAFLWDMIWQNGVVGLEAELKWLASLRNGLANRKGRLE
jgi:PadR family transcriptional regulator, regulatory protein AphA